MKIIKIIEDILGILILYFLIFCILLVDKYELIYLFVIHFHIFNIFYYIFLPIFTLSVLYIAYMKVREYLYRYNIQYFSYFSYDNFLNLSLIILYIIYYIYLLIFNTNWNVEIKYLLLGSIIIFLISFLYNFSLTLGDDKCVKLNDKVKNISRFFVNILLSCIILIYLFNFYLFLFKGIHKFQLDSYPIFLILLLIIIYRFVLSYIIENRNKIKDLCESKKELQMTIDTDSRKINSLSLDNRKQLEQIKIQQEHIKAFEEMVDLQRQLISNLEKYNKNNNNNITKDKKEKDNSTKTTDDMKEKILDYIMIKDLTGFTKDQLWKKIRNLKVFKDLEIIELRKILNDLLESNRFIKKREISEANRSVLRHYPNY